MTICLSPQSECHTQRALLDPQYHSLMKLNDTFNFGHTEFTMLEEIFEWRYNWICWFKAPGRQCRRQEDNGVMEDREK